MIVHPNDSGSWFLREASVSCNSKRKEGSDAVAAPLSSLGGEGLI